MVPDYATCAVRKLENLNVSQYNIVCVSTFSSKELNAEHFSLSGDCYITYLSFFSTTILMPLSPTKREPARIVSRLSTIQFSI